MHPLAAIAVYQIYVIRALRAVCVHGMSTKMNMVWTWQKHPCRCTSASKCAGTLLATCAHYHAEIGNMSGGGTG